MSAPALDVPPPLRIPLWLQVLLLAAPMALFAVVALRVTSLPAPPPLTWQPTADGRRFGVDLALRTKIYSEIAVHEEHWRQINARFTDPWSRHDDFHYHVGRHVLHLAKVYNLHYSQVFLIYDEGIRKGWTGPAGNRLPATWVPLKPRTR